MHSRVKRARRIAELLDRQFEFFGIRVGLDPVISLVPFVGDVAVILLSFYTVWVAWKEGVPVVHILRMIFHIAVDVVVGTIPVVGDIFDIFYKANMRNVKILQDHVSS